MTNARRPDARCPLRPGEPCTLCHVNAHGPNDCPSVYLVMTDDELRDGLHAFAQRYRELSHAGPTVAG